MNFKKWKQLRKILAKFHRNGGESSERSLRDKNREMALVFGVTAKHPPLCIHVRSFELC